MKFSWVALLSLVAGGGLTALGTALGQILPKYATIIMGVVGIVGIVAGVILQAMQPTEKLTDNAKAYNAQGQVTGENVTTTTTAAIIAPQKGA